MEVRVDFSLFSSPTRAYGNVVGELDLPALPPVGSRLNLAPPLGSALPAPSFPGFCDRLLVESHIPSAGCDARAMVLLESIVLDDEEQARETMRYFEQAFGFFGWVYESVEP